MASPWRGHYELRYSFEVTEQALCLDLKCRFIWGLGRLLENMGKLKVFSSPPFEEQFHKLPAALRRALLFA